VALLYAPLLQGGLDIGWVHVQAFNEWIKMTEEECEVLMQTVSEMVQQEHVAPLLLALGDILEHLRR
jgi:hypothetical protein